MKNLELKHLAPYLPYRLKAYHTFEGHKLTRDVTLYNVMNFITGDTNAKIALRPLSDLTEEYIGELEGYHNFSSMHYSEIRTDPTRYPYTIVQKLIEWHFDVFGLIPAGLAIDKNTL